MERDRTNCKDVKRARKEEMKAAEAREQQQLHMEIAELKAEVEAQREALLKSNRFRLEMHPGPENIPGGARVKDEISDIIKNGFGVEECDWQRVEGHSICALYQSRASSAEETIIGACTLCYSEGRDDDALLANFSLHKEHTGIGLSRIFIDCIMKQSAQTSSQNLTHVVTKDAGLIKVLVSLGFREVSEAEQQDAFYAAYPDEIPPRDSEMVYMELEQ